jgi:small subunit ribosomal protein S3
MTHKVHPKVFRIRQITDWSSRGFYSSRADVSAKGRYKKGFAEYLKEDFEIRNFLNKKLAKIGIENIEIERFPTKINIIISTARPGLIIGRRGEGVEELKKELEKIIFKKNLTIFKKGKSRPFEVRLEIKEIKYPWLSATLTAQWIAQQIEKRMPFRRTLKQAIEKTSVYKEIQGIRVQVSGRLDGKEIARTEWLRKGKLPRQTIRADIDYGTARAYCTYGVVGVKVWLYKGEKFE